MQVNGTMKSQQTHFRLNVRRTVLKEQIHGAVANGKNNASNKATQREEPGLVNGTCNTMLKTCHQSINQK
jgi:hypothetical protein